MSSPNGQPWMPLELQEIVDRLTAFKASEVHLTLPRKSLAGVLVLLCPNKKGETSVLLTTRAMTMRSFPGETALPGGRMEDQDSDIASTALREALEEVALDSTNGETAKLRVTLITTLQPYLSKNLLFVIPVVAYTTTPAEMLLAGLVPNASEVGSIWTWPLRDFLGTSSTASIEDVLDDQPISKGTRVVRYSYRDVNWLYGKAFRLHEFHHDEMGSDVTGLTAEILLEVALIAFNVESPLYKQRADNQIAMSEMIEAVLAGKAGLNGDERSSLKRGRVLEDTVSVPTLQ